MENIRDLKLEEFYQFCDKELDGISEMELVILKGHVLLEYSMNCYLESISRDNQPNFFKEKFTFADKVKLIKHFSLIGSGNENITKELILFNKLRNDIAHKLSYDPIHLNELYGQTKKKLSDDRIKSNKKLNDRQKLKSSLSFLQGAIFAAFRYSIDEDEIDNYIDSNN